MTTTVRTTWLVIAALSIAIVANCVGIARGEEAQEFWRAERGRAVTVVPRHHYAALRRTRTQVGAVGAAGEGRKVAAPAAQRVARAQPAEQTPAAFADRLLLLAPFDADVPPPLMQLREPLRRAPPERPEPIVRRRMLCLAGVLVVMLAAYVASHEISQRGNLWPIPA